MAKTWNGRLTALITATDALYTLEDPSATSRLLTLVATVSMLLAVLAGWLFLSRVDFLAQLRRQMRQERRPLLKQPEVIGICLYVVVTLLVRDISNAIAREVLVITGAAGLAVFLVMILKEIYTESIQPIRRRAWLRASPAVGGALVVAALTLAFIVTSALGVGWYALT